MSATAPPLPVRALATPTQAATFLELSRSTVHRLLKAGKLPSLKIGKSRRIRWSDLETLASRSEHVPAADQHQLTSDIQ